MTASVEAQLHAAIDNAERLPCLLCRSPEIHTAELFQPWGEWRRLFSNPDRLYGYAICKDCLDGGGREMVPYKLLEAWGRREHGHLH